MRLKKLLKLKSQLKGFTYFITAYIILMITLTGLIEVYNFVTDPIKQEMIAEVLVPSVHAEPSMKEWIKNEIEKAGLDWNTASKLIECESKGNPDAHAVNWDNKAGVDRGLWQISSLYHKEVSNECAYNYKCSTKEAIRIYKEWGGWGAWSCNKLI